MFIFHHCILQLFKSKKCTLTRIYKDLHSFLKEFASEVHHLTAVLSVFICVTLQNLAQTKFMCLTDGFFISHKKPLIALGLQFGGHDSAASNSFSKYSFIFFLFSPNHISLKVFS